MWLPSSMLKDMIRQVTPITDKSHFFLDHTHALLGKEATETLQSQTSTSIHYQHDIVIDKIGECCNRVKAERGMRIVLDTHVGIGEITEVCS